MITCKSITGDDVETEAGQLTMAVCLYGIIVKDGKILISPQWCENGYDFPGGHLELGEKHLDGLIREVKEETGFTVKPLNVIDVFSSFFFHPRLKRPEQNLKVYYACEIVSGEISTDGFDEGETGYAKAAQFVTLKQLKSMKFMCTTQEPLNAILPYLEKLLL